MKTTGFEAIDKAVHELDERGIKAVQRSAVNAGLGVLVNAMRSGAPVGKTGALKRSIDSRFKKYGPRGRKVLAGKAGLNVLTKGQRKKGKFAPHAHLIALGTKDRYAGVKHKQFPGLEKLPGARPSKGAFRGRVSANDWIALATRAASGRALQTAEAAAKRALPKAIAKARTGKK